MAVEMIGDIGGKSKLEMSTYYTNQPRNSTTKC